MMDETVIWLGQAGLLFHIGERIILVDPYLSDSVEKSNPNMLRRRHIEETFFDIKPDIIILTHNHLDHTDPTTLKHYLSDDSDVLVLASENAWREVRKFGGNNNYVMFNRGTVWTEKNIVFTAVCAEHSDNCAIGVIIQTKENKYYITGDTLYNKEIFEDVPKDIDVMFLPVNGVGNNMNMQDAKCFCEKIMPKYAVPIHFGMFDDIDVKKFDYKNKIIPQLYKEIKLR